MTKVRFVSKGGPHLASYRLRMQLPAQELKRRGYDASIGPYEPADVHIFAKHWDADDIANAKRSPCPIFDICDDHLHGPRRRHYLKMCHTANVMVASSEKLAERISSEVHGAIYVIPEPYELPRGKIRIPEKVETALWYGLAGNFANIILPKGVELYVVTNMPDMDRGSVHIRKYSLERLRIALDQCDAVIIPQRHDWKSANRIVTAIWAGRWPYASDIPAYREFGLPLGEAPQIFDVPMNEALLRDAQNYVGDYYSPRAIGDLWQMLIDHARS